MKSLFLLLIFCISAFIANAQIKCGHVLSQSDDARLVRNIKNSNRNTARSGMVDIPMQLHLVARANGNSRISDDLALEGVCELNVDLAQAGISVYLTEEINYIDNDLAYEHAINDNSANFYLSNQKVPNAINVFIIGNIDNNFAGYYTGQFDLVVMDKDFIGNDSPIFAHEMGHFFSLAHTFSGWEGTVAEEFVRAPEFVGNFQREVEYVDRSINCETGGDRLCDTPADYNISASTDFDCDFDLNYFDPDSILLDPDETNHMSYLYFHGCDDYVFSEDQLEVIDADIASRINLNNIPLPELLEVTEVADLLAPIEDQQLDVFEDVLLEWEPVENATKYMVQLSFNSQLIVVTHRELTDGTNVQISGLDQNKKYYWRVRAFNEVDFCGNEFSEIQSFRTGDQTSTATSNFDALGNVIIYPNPVNRFSDITVYYSGVKARVKSISIIDSKGSEIRYISVPTHNPEELIISDIQAGFYIALIKTSKGSIIEKIVVL